MSNLRPQSLTEMVLERVGHEMTELEARLAGSLREMAAAMVDPREKTNRPMFLGRRMATVTAVSAVPGQPLTATVNLAGITVPGASPQSTYRPIVGDVVWLEFSGPDPQISSPVTTDLNRKWNTIGYIGAWGPVAGAHAEASYWRDAEGMVYMRGRVAGGNDSTQFGAVAIGSRPPAEQTFAAACLKTSFQVAAISVSSAGILTYHGPNTPDWVDLSTVHFRID
ncbi:MAG TPA: hypothetical protein VF244_03905 [Acidimicrobiales bacterium]